MKKSIEPKMIVILLSTKGLLTQNFIPKIDKDVEVD